MRFQQLHRQLQEQVLGSLVESCEYFYNHKIVKTQHGTFVDGRPTHFQSIAEAKQHIKQQSTFEFIDSQINEQSFKTLPVNVLTSIIQRYDGTAKVTDTLIENYINVAASKAFTTNSVVYDMRVMNRTNRLLEGYLDYILDDGTAIAISEQEQKSINTLLEHHEDVVNFMKQSKQNFLEVLEQLKD